MYGRGKEDPSNLLVNNNFCRKLVSSLKLPFVFVNNIKTDPAPFYIADFNSFTFASNNVTSTLLYGVILYYYNFQSK